MYVYVFVSYVYSASGGQKRVPDPPGLEFQKFVSCHIGAKIQT